MRDLQCLVESAVVSAAAWDELWIAIEPALWELVDRPRFASHLAHTEDSRRRIVTAIHAHLETDLALYLDARRINARLSFARWLRTLAKRIAMAHARGARVSSSHEAIRRRRGVVRVWG